MKRLSSAFCLLLLLSGLAHAAFAIYQTALPSNPNLRQENFFGLTGANWTGFTGSYTPGLGNPAVATDDYYHQNGLSGFRPYDLLDPTWTGACASAGASIAASRGRYAWVLVPDHGSGNASVWNGSFNFRMGYSSDPGVPPARMSTIYLGENAVASVPISTITASISNGSGGAGNILAVTAYTGIITNGGAANVSGAGVTTAAISSQSSGTAGQTGNYVISGAAQFVTSQMMTVSQTNYLLYYDASLICNPDDATTPFWIYAEGQASSVQHEMGVIKSADLLTWTTPVPTHNSLNFNTWSSFQRINRIGTGNWVSKGFENSYPQNGNVSARSTWISTDGNVWVPGTTNLNWCLPASSQSGTTTDCTGANRQVAPAQSPDTITVGGSPWIMGKISTFSGTTRVGDQWVGRAAVNGNQSVIDTPAAANVSSPYAGVYPGPTYLQVVTGYVEDGIAHYYAAKGWPISNALWGVVSFATYANGGGLWQQSLDYYTEIIDASAAAGAAPVGVRASCASSTATVNWYTGVTPTDTMRLYRGTTSGSQTTLVGDFTGGVATDTGMTLNAVTYYKLVYLSSGVEQKNRVVSTYCSTSSAFVNAHMTRALADGADSTTCNRTMMDTFDSWLISNSLSNNLLFATMADFCVAKSGSVVTKVYDMGSTRLPRGGDYTPLTANVTYSATGINSKPAWTNPNGTDYGYYGGGSAYLNNIRRKTQITLFAAYQKPSTGAYQPFVSGQGTIRMLLQHSSGTPGGINCLLSDATQQKTATATMASATAVNTAACTFDGTTWLAYGNAAAGSGQTGLVIPSPDLNPPDILTGQIGISSNVQVLMSGSDTGYWNRGSVSYTPNGSASQSSVRAQMVFDKALSGAQITSLDALVR